ncbi:MAG: hypothetical protein P9M14_16560 [Candidatus Alcyoniella australis]|nr:hypothetical protein [Candidatus Alcyoniella australis]
MLVTKESARELILGSFSTQFLKGLTVIAYEATKRSREIACEDQFSDHVRPHMAGQNRWGLIESLLLPLVESTPDVIGEKAKNATGSSTHYEVRSGRCILTVAASRNRAIPKKAVYRLDLSQSNQLSLFDKNDADSDSPIYVVLNFGSCGSCRSKENLNDMPEWILLQVPDVKFRHAIAEVSLKELFPDVVAKYEQKTAEESIPVARTTPKRNVAISEG